MLRELRIRNFAIMEEARLEFSDGLNVITGETGAGKSIILEALGMALGDRASRESVRAGAEEAVVELVVEDVAAAVLEGFGIPTGEDLIIRRQISSGGKGRIYISGALSTVQNLRDILLGTVDVHGQFEHQALLAEHRQMGLLDAAAGHQMDVEELGRLFGSWKEAREELEAFRSMQRDFAQRADLLRYQAEEIDNARLSAGEDEALESERSRLANAERLASLAERGRELLRGDDVGAIDHLYGALADLEKITEMDPGAETPVEALREAIARTEEAADFFRIYGEGLEHTPGRLDEVMQRLDQIDRLKRKYGNTIEAVLAHGERVRAELGDVEDPEGRARELEASVREAGDAYEGLATRVGVARRKAAGRFGKGVQEVLRELAIPGGRFEIEVSGVEPGPSGTDRVRFLFSANPGEALQPLAKIASGGELSRVMLAIKGVLGDTTPVLVFDEVDAGIGGEAAVAVGRRLQALSRNHQVICVTHQPAVAARGRRHLRIRKIQSRGRTLVEVSPVTDGERVEELARMLGGAPTEVSRRHAEELLAAGT